MQRNSTAIDRQNISVLPTDERIFPADVVALARKIDALEIQWEETHVAASKEACEQNLKSAELLDAQALKNKILAGDTEGLDATPNVDRAHRENHAASASAPDGFSTAAAMWAAGTAARPAVTEQDATTALLDVTTK